MEKPTRMVELNSMKKQRNLFVALLVLLGTILSLIWGIVALVIAGIGIAGALLMSLIHCWYFSQPSNPKEQLSFPWLSRLLRRTAF